MPLSTKIAPTHGESGSPSNTWFPGPTRVLDLNDISILPRHTVTSTYSVSLLYNAVSSIFQFQQLICVFTASPYTASQTHKKYKYAFPFTKTTTYTNRTQITQKSSFTDTYHPATSSAVATTMRISRRRTDYQNRYHGKSYRAVPLEQSAKQSSYQMLEFIQGPSRSTAYSPLNWQLKRCPSIGAHDLTKTATKRLSKPRLHRGQVSDRRPRDRPRQHIVDGYCAENRCRDDRRQSPETTRTRRRRRTTQIGDVAAAAARLSPRRQLCHAPVSV